MNINDQASSSNAMEETAPLLYNMVSEKVSISQQVLVSQSSLSSTRRSTQYLAALIATVGGFIAGSCLAWTSPVETRLRNGEYGFSVSKDEMAWIGSFMPLGAILGSIITAPLVDSIGRKNTILTLVAPVLIGWGLILIAESVTMMCLGRFLTGIGTGSYCVVVPIYTSEIAEKDIRGTLGTYLQLQITIGILVVYALGSYVNVFTLTVVCGLIPIMYAVLMYFMPETPYFHLKKGNTVAAQQSLTWFRGERYDGKSEIDMMQKGIEDDKADKIPFLMAFQTRAAKRGLIIGISIMLLQQFSGCNAVIFYTKSIFLDAGAAVDSSQAGAGTGSSHTGGAIDSSLSTIIVGIAQVITTWIASLIIDKLGRRILLLLSIVIMTLSTFTLGLYFYLKDDIKQNVSDIAWLPLLSLSCYIIMFSIGFGPIPWMLIAEIFPSKIKGPASSIACVTNWVSVFIVTKLFPLFVIWFGTGITFWCFTCCCGIGILFVLFMVPETKGKTLLEVQEILGGNEISRIPARPANQYAVGAAFGESKIKM